MKIVMGVDDLERAKDTTAALQAMRFPDSYIEAVHVVENWGGELYLSSLGGRPDVLAQYAGMRHEQGQELLTNVENVLKLSGFEKTKTHLLTGHVSNRLIEQAENSKADLIALASSDKGPIEGIMIGSVGRKVAISSARSFFVVKKPPSTKQPLTAVIATDHSEYANNYIEELTRWSPRGIGRLIVTTVYPEQLVKAMTAMVQDFKADVNGWIRTELERSNQAVINRFTEFGAECKSRVESGPVGDTLERVMKEEHADLLIMGAQGHGFVERLTLGSVSLDQVVRRPYSVLIVRK